MLPSARSDLELGLASELGKIMKRSAAIPFLAAIFLAATALADSPPNTPTQPPEAKTFTTLANQSQAPEGPSVSQQWHPNGIPAGEAHYLNGKKQGAYSLWYPNGVVKVKCQYDQGKLNGPCEAWFEIGRKRLAISFDEGRKDGQWLRFGEKVDDVAKLNFNHDALNGPVWVLINRGHGSGTGTSYQMLAQYDQGRLTGPFRFSYTDGDGRQVMLAGRMEAERPVVEETKNVAVSPQGVVTVSWTRGTKEYSRSGGVFYRRDEKKGDAPLRPGLLRGGIRPRVER